MVSVIIPAYNAERYIERTLNSVLSQSYKNLEVLVVDDESQDRTAEIVKTIARRDPRVILWQQKNSGAAAARNLGIQQSTGEFIAPIDADDIWYPQHLEKQIDRFLEGSSKVGVVYSWSADIDDRDALTGEFRVADIEGDVYQTLICHNFIGNSSATLIDRRCLEKVGSYTTELQEQNAQGCEDWDLYLRLAERYEFRVVPEFTVGYRQLDNSMSCDCRKMAKSHALMLQKIEDCHPRISSLLYRLSSSSFYIYLARQSSGRGDRRAALLWLKEAIAVDWVTPLLRFGFYSIAIKSWLRLLTERILPQTESGKRERSRNFKSELRHPPKLTLKTLKRKHFAIQFRLLVGRVFHQILNSI